MNPCPGIKGPAGQTTESQTLILRTEENQKQQTRNLTHLAGVQVWLSGRHAQGRVGASSGGGGVGGHAHVDGPVVVPLDEDGHDDTPCLLDLGPTTT